jgi:hypothetical protein
LNCFSVKYTNSDKIDIYNSHWVRRKVWRSQMGLSVLLWFTASDHLFWYLLFIVLSVLWITSSDHLFWYLLFIVLSVLLWLKRWSEAVNQSRTDNTMNKRYQKRWWEAIHQRRTALNYGFWSSRFGIFCSLYCLFFFDVWLLNISFVSLFNSKNRQYNEQKIPKEMIRSSNS